MIDTYKLKMLSNKWQRDFLTLIMNALWNLQADTSAIAKEHLIGYKAGYAAAKADLDRLLQKVINEVQ